MYRYVRVSSVRVRARVYWFAASAREALTTLTYLRAEAHAQACVRALAPGANWPRAPCARTRSRVYK